MSSIGPVGGADKQLTASQQPKIDKSKENANKEPKDKVQISKPRKVFEKVVGSPMAALNSVTSAVGGFFGGGVSGVTGRSRKADLPYALGTGAAYIAAGATAGTMVGGVIGGIAGGIGGLVIAGLGGASGSMEKVGGQIGEAAEKAVSDNMPSDSKLKDASRAFTEGAFTGLGVGAAGGFKEGSKHGAGIVSGVIEGTKGAAASVLGKYEKPAEPKPEKPKKSIGKKVLHAVLGAPRMILGTAAGVVGGVAGAAMESVDGLIQGTVIGVDSSEKADKTPHGVIMRIETALAGTAAGFMTGGFIGAAIGLGGGLLAGHLIRRVEKKSGTDKEIAENLTRAVRHAQKDNAYENKADEYGDRVKNPYESFRDGVEGAMTGTAAGVREGFKAGYAGGKGVVDGVFDGVGGVISGIFGGITGK